MSLSKLPIQFSVRTLVEIVAVCCILLAWWVNKQPFQTHQGNLLEIEVAGTLIELPIWGLSSVDTDGNVNLGARYGKVHVSGTTVESATERIREQFKKTLAAPVVSVSIVGYGQGLPAAEQLWHVKEENQKLRLEIENLKTKLAQKFNWI